MPFSGDNFTHLFDWEKDPQRQEKIVNSRLEAEFDGIDTGLSAAAARITVVEGETRDRLTGNRTYYVRTDGSDSNTGLVNSAGGAFLTLQKAVDVIVGTLDLSGFAVTINMVNTSSPSTFTGGAIFSGPWSGGGTVTIQGSTGTASDVIISTTSASCVQNTGVLPGILTVKDIELRTTTSGMCLENLGVGTMNFSNVRFGACAVVHIYCIAPAAKIEATGNYAITGGAASGHLFSAVGGGIFVEGRTITVSAGLTFGIFAQAVTLGAIVFAGNSFSTAAATGKRYNVTLNSVINTNGKGVNHFPGDVTGTTATGGVYN